MGKYNCLNRILFLLFSNYTLLKNLNTINLLDFQMLKTLFNQNSIADKYKNLVNQINVLENTMQTLTDSELRAKTFELKKIYPNKQNKEFLIANSFAIAREASIRTLGLDTGLIQENMPIEERQQNYDADVTYVTNSELGFDFLRDNMALNLKEVVLRPFSYCIVDEVDSILIDEAQTPLIISNTIHTSIDKFV